jgi:TPR repeat protein
MRSSPDDVTPHIGHTLDNYAPNLDPSPGHSSANYSLESQGTTHSATRSTSASGTLGEVSSTKSRASDIEILQADAERGIPAAQYNLGYYHEIGKGVERDYTKAAYWYRKAAEHGDSDAQFAMGKLYKSGQGVEQNAQEAVKWYRKASEGGSAAAQNSLGIMYQSGTGVPHDDVTAYSMYYLAAKHGSTTAAANRDNLAKTLTPDQIAAGQRRAAEFMKGQKSSK